MSKYEISCKNCINGNKTGRYIGCTLGKGTFPLSSRFESCDGYKTPKQYREELKKKNDAIRLSKMIESGVK